MLTRARGKWRRLVLCARRGPGRCGEEFIVNTLDLAANLAPIELRQDCRVSICGQFLSQSAIVQKGDNTTAEGLDIVIRHYEGIMHMSDAFGAARKRNGWFAS